MSDMRHLLDIINESEFYKENIEVGDDFDLEFGEDLLIESYVVEIDDENIIIEGDDKVLELLLEYGIDLEEGDVLKGNFPQFNADKATKQDKIDYQGLYKEFITSQNYGLAKKKGQLSSDENWLTLATGYLKSKGYDKMNPYLLGNMANRLHSMHKAHERGHDFAAESKASRILEGIKRVDEKMVIGLPGDQGSKVMGEDWDDEAGYDTDDPKHPDYAERRAEKAEHKRDQEREKDIDEAKYQGREVPLGKPMKGDVKKSKVYVRGPKGNVVKVNFGDKKMKIKKSNPKRRKSFRARHNCKNPGPRWKARYWSCRAW